VKSTGAKSKDVEIPDAMEPSTSGCNNYRSMATKTEGLKSPIVTNLEEE
jgi:hypothetical protein